MKCPICGAWTRVLSTRHQVLRQRECANGHRFTTEEVVVPSAPHGGYREGAGRKKGGR